MINVGNAKAKVIKKLNVVKDKNQMDNDRKVLVLKKEFLMVKRLRLVEKKKGLQKLKLAKLKSLIARQEQIKFREQTAINNEIKKLKRLDPKKIRRAEQINKLKVGVRVAGKRTRSFFTKLQAGINELDRRVNKPSKKNKKDPLNFLGKI